MVINNKIADYPFIEVEEFEFSLSRSEPNLKILLRPSPRPKPLCQSLYGGRNEKNNDCLVRISFLEEECSPNIDIEDNIVPCDASLLKSFFEGAVEISVSLLPFDEFSPANPLLEFGAREKMVTDAIDFSRSGRTRGRRDAFSEGSIESGGQMIPDGRLTATRRPNKDVEKWRTGHARFPITLLDT